jgi:iron uptake system component EfeO
MSLIRRATPVAGLVTVLGIGLAACSGSGAGPASSPASVVDISAFEYAFDPSTVEVHEGPVTFEVTNTGTVEHEFEILNADGGVVDEVEGLVPGLTRDLTVDLQPGIYTYVCRIAGHEQAGMTGTLTVDS